MFYLEQQMLNSSFALLVHMSYNKTIYISLVHTFSRQIDKFYIEYATLCVCVCCAYHILDIHTKILNLIRIHKN